MEWVTLPVKCPGCSEQFKVKLNTFTAEHEVLSEFQTNYKDLKILVEAYKALKGYDKIPTWDTHNRARHFATAKKILYFFRKVKDPLGVSIECVRDLWNKADKEGWQDKFRLETVLKMAPDWIVAKQRQP